MESPQHRILSEALEIFNTRDPEAAQRFVEDHFGEDTDLNIVKCDMCGEIIALCVNIIVTGITGGDKRVNLQIYKHIKEHRTHMNHIYGHSHGVRLPLGQTLGYTITRVAKSYDLSLDEALDSRIAHLEEKLKQT